MKIYALDGSTQCGMSAAVPLEEMAGELKEAGVAVKDQASRRTPLLFPAACGQPTGQANVFEIDPADLAKAMKLPRGYQPWLFDVEQVDVYKFDGSTQCNPDAKATSPETVKAELQTRGIDVKDVRKDHLGLIPQLCGFPTGAVNVATIPASQYTVASTLGYSLFSVHVSSSSDSPAMREGFGRMLDAQNFRLSGPVSLTPINDPEGPVVGPLPRPVLPFDPHLPPFKPVPWEPMKPLIPQHAHLLISDLPNHVFRLIRPGDPITYDLRKERFNIAVDEHNVIVSVGFY